MAAYGWIEVKARNLHLPGSGLYLLRRDYFNSLWKPGARAGRRAWAGHNGTGQPAMIHPLSTNQGVQQNV